MAKKTSGRQSKKSKSYPIETPDVPVEEVIEDAEVVAEETVEAAVEEAAEVTADAEAEPVEEAVQDAPVEEVSEPEVEEEKPIETDTSEAPTPTPVEEPARSNSFIPLVLGGAVAGIIGYGIATLQPTEEPVAYDEMIAAQADEIASLKTELSDIAARQDPAELVEQIAANGTSVTDLGDRIDSAISGLDERMTTVEKQPSADGTLQEAAVAAYERDIAELREQISGQQDELRALLSETREEAQSIEQNAIASARNATARASLAIVQGALETGAPMGAALIDLDGSTEDPVPEALMAAGDGVATLSALQAEFPEFARAALGVARNEGASGEDAGGMASFLRSQFDVRSVEPQEGDGADAVLSRAEAALREGRLNDTLAEIAALPEVVRGALTEWTAKAEMRAAAIDAASTLASQLNVN